MQNSCISHCRIPSCRKDRILEQLVIAYCLWNNCLHVLRDQYKRHKKYSATKIYISPENDFQWKRGGSKRQRECDNWSFFFWKASSFFINKSKNKKLILLWYKPKANRAIKRKPVKSTKRGAVILEVIFIGWYVYQFEQQQKCFLV